jgi:hypothetical protein
MYRLDRTAFKINTFREAENNRAYWLSKSPEERFAGTLLLVLGIWITTIHHD